MVRLRTFILEPCEARSVRVCLCYTCSVCVYTTSTVCEVSLTNRTDGILYIYRGIRQPYNFTLLRTPPLATR